MSTTDISEPMFTHIPARLALSVVFRAHSSIAHGCSHATQSC